MQFRSDCLDRTLGCKAGRNQSIKSEIKNGEYKEFVQESISHDQSTRFKTLFLRTIAEHRSIFQPMQKI